MPTRGTSSRSAVHTVSPSAARSRPVAGPPTATEETAWVSVSITTTLLLPRDLL